MRAERVLLLRPDRAGDALKTLPALRAAVRLRPTWEWHVLTSGYNHSLLEREPGVRAHRLPVDWEKEPRFAWHRALPALPPRFDRVVSLLCDRREAVDELLAALPAPRKFAAAAPEVPGVKEARLPGGPVGRDEAENVALILESSLDLRLLAQVDWLDTAPRLAPEDEAEAEAALGRKKGRRLGVCPLSSEPRQCHPPARWAKLLRRIAGDETIDRIFVLAAPSERGRLEALVASAGSPPKASVVTPSSFRALGAYLKRLDGMVGVDSGPAHLARALGVPTLSLLAGADGERWFGPLGPAHHVLRRGRLGRFPLYLEMLFAFRAWRRWALPA